MGECVDKHLIMVCGSTCSSTPYVGMALKKDGGHIKSAQITHLLEMSVLN